MKSREHAQRRHELLELAHWVERQFDLGAQPKIHSAKESEVIYAQILKRIAGHSTAIEQSAKESK